MREFIKNLSKPRQVSRFALLAMVLMSSACGNKGELYLDGSQLLVDTARVPSIELALDELEILEAEESGKPSKVLKSNLLDGTPPLNSN